MVATYALDLYYGDTVARTFVVWLDDAKTQPADFTGVTAKSQIRDAQLGDLCVELAATVTLPNQVTVTLAPANWPAYFAAGVWDLQLTYADGRVVTLVAGPVRVIGDVTRVGP